MENQHREQNITGIVNDDPDLTGYLDPHAGGRGTNPNEHPSKASLFEHSLCWRSAAVRVPEA